MSDKRLTGDEIQRRGLDAPMRELGPEGMVRFLQQLQTGSGDYTADRERILPTSTVDQIVSEIVARRGKHDGDAP